MARQPQVQYINFYTAGSAAYRYEEPVRRKAEVTLPKPRRRKRIILKVDPVAVLGLCVAVVLLVMMICGACSLVSARQQQMQMASYVQTLQNENAKLQEEYEQGYDLEEIYEIATAMGMIPAEQAQHIRISVTEVEAEEELSGWENFCMFLTGLFA